MAVTWKKLLYSGDITNSDIASGAAIDLTKLQSLNAYRLLGNSDGSSGSVGQISLGGTLEFNSGNLQVKSGTVDAAYLNGYSSGSSGADAHILLTSASGGLTISGGLNLGTAGSAGAGDIKISGTIRESTPIACKVKRTTAYTIGNASWTAVPMETAIFEQPSDLDMWSSGTNPSRITCKVAGLYLIIASIKWFNNSTGIRGVAVYLNNSTFIAQDTGPNLGTINFVMACTTIQYLNVNDYVECKAYQNSGGNLDLTITDDTTSLSLVKLA